MKPAARKGIILTALGVVVVGGIAWQAVRLSRPRVYTLKSATVTKLDAATRSGEIEFVHPKSGRAMTVAARNIPADCEITIDGVAAALADVRVGDTVAVHGVIYPDHTVKPDWVRVRRSAAATQPATSTNEPADDP